MQCTALVKSIMFTSIKTRWGTRRHQKKPVLHLLQTHLFFVFFCGRFHFGSPGSGSGSKRGKSKWIRTQNSSSPQNKKKWSVWTWIYSPLAQDKTDHTSPGLKLACFYALDCHNLSPLPPTHTRWIIVYTLNLLYSVHTWRLKHLCE